MNARGHGETRLHTCDIGRLPRRLVMQQLAGEDRDFSNDNGCARPEGA